MGWNPNYIFGNIFFSSACLFGRKIIIPNVFFSSDQQIHSSVPTKSFRNEGITNRRRGKPLFFSLQILIPISFVSAQGDLECVPYNLKILFSKKTYLIFNCFEIYIIIIACLARAKLCTSFRETINSFFIPLYFVTHCDWFHSWYYTSIFR